MKRTKIILTTVIIFGAIVGILIYNKSRSESKTKNDMSSSVSVSVGTVTREKIESARTFVGTMAANNDVAILAETQGKVIAVMAEVGQFVSAGSPIVQVDDEVKQANLATAEVNYERAKKDLERFESLGKENAATDQQVEAARLAFKSAEAQYILVRRQYRDTKISTPISGIVTSRTVDVGSMVLDKMVVGNVVDISKLKLKVNVAEKDAFILKPGDDVEVTTDVYPGVKFPGKIRTISSKADEAHTYPVEIILPNSKEHPLKAGMFGSATVVSKGEQQSLTIPREALIGSTKNPQVFVVDGSTAKLKTIVVGSQSGSSLTVLDGLNEGDQIVVAGQNNLKDGTAVTIIK